MVWFQYRLDALQDNCLAGPGSPGTPKSPSTPNIDPNRFIDEEDAIDLYFYLKDIVSNAGYDNMVLDRRGFCSFHVLDLVISRKVNADDTELNMEISEHGYPIQTFSERQRRFDIRHFREWRYTYNNIINIVHEYLNLSLYHMGKKIDIPKRILTRFMYENSSGYISECC